MQWSLLGPNIPTAEETGPNNTTLTLGMQNVFDTDPPFVAGAIVSNYDTSLATIKGRYWYAQLKKQF